MMNHKRYLISDSYEQSYKETGSFKSGDQSSQAMKDRKTLLKRVMGEIKSEFDLKTPPIRDGGSGFLFVDYYGFSVGVKRKPGKKINYSVVVMDSDGGGEIWVSNKKSLFTAVNKYNMSSDNTNQLEKMGR